MEVQTFHTCMRSVNMSIHMLCSNYTEIEQRKYQGAMFFRTSPEESDEAEAAEPQKHERVRKGITSISNTKETSKTENILQS